MKLHLWSCKKNRLRNKEFNLDFQKLHLRISNFVWKWSRTMSCTLMMILCLFIAIWQGIGMWVVEQALVSIAPWEFLKNVNIKSNVQILKVHFYIMHVKSIFGILLNGAVGKSYPYELTFVLTRRYSYGTKSGLACGSSPG